MELVIDQFTQCLVDICKQAIPLILFFLRAYPQISNCGIIATKGGGKNGEKELQVMDNIRCVLGGRKG